MVRRRRAVERDAEYGQGRAGISTASNPEQPNLLTPGSWTMTQAGATTAVESPNGTLTITPDNTNDGSGDQSATTVIGRTYRLTATVATNAVLVDAGTAQGGTQLINEMSFAAGKTSVTFVATAATTWVRFHKTTTGATVITSIMLRLVPGV